MDESYIQIITAAERREDAERIAAVLLEKRLAACVQVLGPMTSRYWWKGKIEAAEEWLCQIKSRASLYDDVEREIRAVHPYTVPEILAFPVQRGNPDYLSWLDEETKI
jgi:periplasmic divalent cation tolerance protein